MAPAREHHETAAGARSAEPGPIVVRVTEEAWPVLRAARLAALADAPAAFATTLAEARAYGDDRWRETLCTGATFVALLGRSPVGMVAAIPRRQRDECGLGAMWVDPAWRGRGLADRLAAEVVAWARTEGKRRIDLWAPADDPRARGFYQRAGFVPTGLTRPFPGAPGRRITQMSLGLPTVQPKD